MSGQDVDEAKAEPGYRQCDQPSCTLMGEYRAPKSRSEIREYYWFCLDHVRAYNRGWDYFAGMSEAQIEEYQRNNAFGHRPTWRLGMRAGENGAKGRRFRNANLFGEEFGYFAPESGGPAGHEFKPGERHALALLNLEWPVSLKQLKDRYKELVKLNHPDANGGDRSTEERLKKIIHAYGHLRKCDYS